MLTLGIIGGGYVGTATSLLKGNSIKVYIYDIDPTKQIPPGTTLRDVIDCDLIFICVPTPSSADGSCNVSIVESVVKELRLLNPRLDNIIIRSTVPPGTSRRLQTHFMPEFLTEHNWKNDFVNSKPWIIGLNEEMNSNRIKDVITILIETAQQNGSIKNKDLVFVSPEEAECAKYVRNSFLATKIAFFNEVQEYCHKYGLDYKTIRQLVILDQRIGESHTRVPGFDNQYGFGGTCLPKDLSAFIVEIEKLGLNSIVMKAIQSRNHYDHQRN